MCRNDVHSTRTLILRIEKSPMEPEKITHNYALWFIYSWEGVRILPNFSEFLRRLASCSVLIVDYAFPVEVNHQNHLQVGSTHPPFPALPVYPGVLTPVTTVFKQFFNNIGTLDWFSDTSGRNFIAMWCMFGFFCQNCLAESKIGAYIFNNFSDSQTSILAYQITNFGCHMNIDVCWRAKPTASGIFISQHSSCLETRNICSYSRRRKIPAAFSTRVSGSL